MTTHKIAFFSLDGVHDKSKCFQIFENSKLPKMNFHQIVILDFWKSVGFYQNGSWSFVKALKCEKAGALAPSTSKAWLLWPESHWMLSTPVLAHNQSIFLSTQAESSKEEGENQMWTMWKSIKLDILFSKWKKG